MGLRAVLLNYDVMVNYEEDHYVVYNNDKRWFIQRIVHAASVQIAEAHYRGHR